MFNLKRVLSDEVSGKKQLRLQVILPTTQTKSISDCFIINMNSSRALFNRGREFEIQKGFSDIVRDCVFCYGINNYCSFVQMNYHYGESVRKLILHHGYVSDSVSPKSAILEFVRTVHKGDGIKLFVKMIERCKFLFLLLARLVGIEQARELFDQMSDPGREENFNLKRKYELLNGIVVIHLGSLDILQI